MSQLDLPVLVLNLNYEPLNVCTTKRAMVLLVIGKAEVMENGRGYIRTPSTVYPRPSVIRLGYMIKRPSSGKAEPSGDLPAGQPYLPILWWGNEAVDGGPRRAPPPWRRVSLGESGERLPCLQPPKRGQDASGGSHELAATPL